MRGEITGDRGWRCRRGRVAAVALLVSGVVALAGCGSSATTPADRSTPADTSGWSAPTPRPSSSVDSSLPMSASPPADVVAGAAPNTLCGTVATGNRPAQPVAVLSGRVDCGAAMTIADKYLSGVDRGQAQGQGLRLDVSGWSCFWPYVPGRSHADSYLQCDAPDATLSLIHI